MNNVNVRACVERTCVCEQMYVMYLQVMGFHGICGFTQKCTFNVEEEELLQYFTHI